VCVYEVPREYERALSGPGEQPHRDGLLHRGVDHAQCELHLHVRVPAASLPGWVLETARARFWNALKARHPILSVWFVYDKGAPRAMRLVVIYIEAVWLMAFQALAFYLTFPPTLLAVCAAYTTECDCTRMSGPFDPRAPACAWLEDGHAEDWSRGGCLDAPSGGACAYREPEDDDPYLLLLFMLIVSARDIPMRLGLGYQFYRVILAPARA
jgi:hypothetical protein